MRSLTLYIGRQVLFATLSVIAVLTCIVWLAQSLRFIELVASKGVTISVFMQMIFFLLPNLVVIVIPIAVLTAILFIYNKLITDHELLVMQSSGFSYWQLAKPGLLVATLFTGVMYIFNLYVLPVSSQNFRELEWSLKQSKNINILQPGKFNVLGKYTIYIRKKYPNNEVKGVLIYDIHDPAKPVTHMAEYGVSIDEGDVSRLILFNGSTQERDSTTGRPNILYFDQYTLETKGSQKAKKRKVKAQEFFVPDLLNPKDPKLKTRVKLNMIAEGHQRLISPLYCIIFSIIALSALMLFPYSRRGRQKQIIGSAILVCSFYVVSLLLLNMLKSLTFAISALYGIVFLFIIGGLWALSPFGPFSGSSGRKK